MFTYILLLLSTANIFLAASGCGCENYTTSIIPSFADYKNKFSRILKLLHSYVTELEGRLRNESCGGDPHAMPGCGTNCGKNCLKTNICPLICKVDGCDCKDGYLFDSKQNKCVRPKNCTNQCGPNEVLSDCANGGCTAKKCSEIGQSIPCVKPKICTKGCLCKNGYLQDDNGNCVSMQTCLLEQCPKPNEVFDANFTTCAPQTCENIGKTFHCPLMPVGGSKTATCRCINGYFRNKIGECISEADCMKCTGPNEYFSCGGACDNVCATLSQQNQTNCPIVNVKCNEMCYCETGFARDGNGTCVSIDMCPESCGGDPNAMPGCGINCGKTCLKTKICPRICKVDGCDCKDGYLFDSKQNKCLRPKDCSMYE